MELVLWLARGHHDIMETRNGLTESKDFLKLTPNPKCSPFLCREREKEPFWAFEIVRQSGHDAMEIEA